MTHHTPPAVAIITARYNQTITAALKQAAIEEYRRRFPSKDPAPLALIDAPGAFELPAIADAAAETGLYRAIVCLGCVIKGETTHDQHINTAVAHALASISLRTATPCAFGVITANNPDQARDRAGGAKGNKGTEAMAATLDAVAAIDAINHAADAGTTAFTFTLDQPATDKAAP